jgi:hypothetical protein
MIAAINMARGKATKVLAMAGQIYAGLIVAGYEVQGRYCDLNDARRPFSFDQLFMSLGVRCLAAVWGSLREELDLLFRASADLGEWVLRILILDLCKVRILRRPSMS